MERLGDFDKTAVPRVSSLALMGMSAVESRSANDGLQKNGREISRGTESHAGHETRVADQAVKRKSDNIEDGTIHQLTASFGEETGICQLSSVDKKLLDDAKLELDNACQSLDVVHDNLNQIARSLRDFTFPVSTFQSMCDTSRMDKLRRVLGLLDQEQMVWRPLPPPPLPSPKRATYILFSIIELIIESHLVKNVLAVVVD